MQRNESHGRHGGNRGLGDERNDQDPNRTGNTDVESQAHNRNENKGRKGSG